MHYYICKQDFIDAVGINKVKCDENCEKCYKYIYLTEEEFNGVLKVLQLIGREKELLK